MSSFLKIETGEGMTLINVAHIVTVSKSKGNTGNTLIELTGQRLIMSTTEFKTITAMLKEC